MTNPFLLRPFTESDSDTQRFFGRDREARSLASRLISDRVVLVHAQTGAGKSSLVAAGLSKLLVDYVVGRSLRPMDIPNLLRVSGTDGSDLPVERQIVTSFARGFPGAELSTVVDVPSLVSACRGARHDAPVMFLVDQLEEVFIHSSSQSPNIRSFFGVLGSLARHPEVWMILVVRDDYLARTLDALAKVSRLAETRFGVPLLSRRRAGEVICATLCRSESELQPAFDQVIGAATQALIREDPRTVDEDSECVLPLFLQMICHHWYDVAVSVVGDGDRDALSRQLAATRIEKTFRAEAFVRFVDEAFEKSAASAAADQPIDSVEGDLREWCEANLVQNGARARKRFPTRPPAGLINLAAGYFIASTEEPEARLELSHDAFVAAVVESNKRWFRKRRGVLSASYRRWRLEQRQPRLLLGLREYIGVRAELPQATRAERDYARRSLDAMTAAVAKVILVAALLVAVMMVYGGIQRKDLLAQNEKIQQLRNEASRFAEENQKLADSNDLGMLSLYLIRASRFSADTLKNDEAALAQAVVGLDLAQQRRRNDGISDAGLSMARSGLLGRIMAGRFIRRAQLQPSELAKVRDYGPCDRRRYLAGVLFRSNFASSDDGSIAGACTDENGGVDRNGSALSDRVRAATDHLWVAPDDPSKSVLFRFASLKTDSGKTMALFLDPFGVSRLQSRSREVPSDDGETRIAASYLWPEKRQVRGVSITMSGVAYGWSVADDSLTECHREQRSRCLRLRLDFAERLVSGKPLAAWRGGVGEASTDVVRIVSDLGEFVELRMRQESRVVSGRREKRAPADVMDFSAGVVFATDLDWCTSNQCEPAFVRKQAVRPLVLLDVSGGAASRPEFAAITGSGHAYVVAKGINKAPARIEGYSKDPADFMLRLAGNRQALVIKNSAVSAASRVSRIDVHEGRLRSVDLPQSSQSLFDAVGGIQLVSGSVSTDNSFAFLGNVDGRSHVVLCRSSGSGAQFDLGPCRGLALSGERRPSAVSAVTDSDGRMVVAVGFNDGAVMVELVAMGSDGVSLVRQMAETRVHAGSVTALSLTGVGKDGGWRLVSGGKDGLVLMADVRRQRASIGGYKKNPRHVVSASDTTLRWYERLGPSLDHRISISFPPTVVDRNTFPVSFIRSGGRQIYIASDNAGLTRLDLDDGQAIKNACAIFEGIYPALDDYLLAAWPQEMAARMRGVDVAHICERALAVPAVLPDGQPSDAQANSVTPGISQSDAPASTLPIIPAASTSLGKCSPSTTREAATSIVKGTSTVASSGK